MRRMTLPPEALLLRRMEGLLFQIASTVRAEADWGALLARAGRGRRAGDRARRRARRVAAERHCADVSESTLKLLSWNVAGRTKLLGEQIAAVARQEPDLVCLQEIRPSTRDALGRRARRGGPRPRARLGRVSQRPAAVQPDRLALAADRAAGDRRPASRAGALDRGRDARTACSTSTTPTSRRPRAAAFSRSRPARRSTSASPAPATATGCSAATSTCRARRPSTAR